MKKTDPPQLQAIEIISNRSIGSRPKDLLEVTINFHPDRLTDQGEPLLVVMEKEGRLKSQFETKTSNGSLSAYVGGKRWQWEHEAFNGVYDQCEPQERPKYGALNYQHNETGASPRFGSAYFRLKSNVLTRTTFCFPDSFFCPEHFSTYDYVDHLINLSSKSEKDVLDNYIEAHIHGEISLVHDVEALVLDPVYLGTDIEKQARMLPCFLQWHSGFTLPIDVFEQHAHYRDDKYVYIAKALEKRELLRLA
ncbi:DUF3626 domain-containing protein [Shewanella surugensis]|uniref:DUF3626 domain-containing protein n=1 Tax=Shewanella surugensis TaxID=212020 RepID=A0ABT0LJQ8_9GAMM|nr:DUF3626 domain-containing protein [Shewanella surugensis]MCL1127527.1 DUF3626 domain-containing protein [Shewanella surugensis]